MEASTWSLTEKVKVRDEVVEVPILELCGPCWEIGSTDLGLSYDDLMSYGEEYHKDAEVKRKTDAARESKKKRAEAVPMLGVQNGIDATTCVVAQRAKVRRTWDIFTEAELRHETGRARMPVTALQQTMVVNVPKETDPSSTEQAFAFPHSRGHTGRTLEIETELEVKYEDPVVASGRALYKGQPKEVLTRSLTDTMTANGVLAGMNKERPTDFEAWQKRWNKGAGQHDDEAKDNEEELGPGKRSFGGAGAQAMIKSLQDSPAKTSQQMSPRGASSQGHHNFRRQHSKGNQDVQDDCSTVVGGSIAGSQRTALRRAKNVIIGDDAATLVADSANEDSGDDGTGAMLCNN